ncbi:hypothetical protein DDN11_11175 [Vibrio cholerae]|nr:hypothetical protein [Vibrio cholerae]
MTTKKPANFAGFFISTTYPKKVATMALQLHMVGFSRLSVNRQTLTDRQYFLFRRFNHTLIIDVV